MKSSRLMVMLLVVQAVLIMGVFAAVPIENSAVAGEEEITAKKCPDKGKPPYCGDCTDINGSIKCQDEEPGDWKTCMDKNSECKTCTVVGYNYKCNDVFNGTCCNKKN